MVEPALSPPLARARPPAQRGRGRGRGRAGGGVVGAAACGVVRGGSAGRPRRGGTMELRAQPRRRRRDPGPVSARCGRTGCLVLAPSLCEFGRAAAPGQGRARAGFSQPRGQRSCCSVSGALGRAAGPTAGRGAAPRLALPPAASSPPSAAPAPASRSRSRPRRPPPSGPGAAGCALPGLRGRLPPCRPQVAPGPRLAPRPPLKPRFRRPGLPGVRDIHILLGPTRPCPQLVQLRVSAARVRPLQPSASLSARLCAPEPCARYPLSRAPGLSGWALRARGRGSGSPAHCRARGEGGAPGAAPPGWISPGRLGERRAGAAAPPPRWGFREWKTFPTPSRVFMGNGVFFLDELFCK